MQALTPISLSFAFFCLFMMAGTTVSAANSYRQIELQHRNASSLQQSLLPLAGDDLVIIAQGNSLILKGPQGELNQLISIIKKLDRPPKQLLVSIYRGIDPSVLTAGAKKQQHQNQRWSTNTGKANRVDTVLVEEGATLVISETQLYSVPLETAEAVARISPEADNGTDLHSRYQHHDNLLVEKGFTLMAALVKDQKGKAKVSLKTTYVLPSSGSSSHQEGQPLSLSTETSTAALVDLQQWQLLSTHQQQSHRPSLDGSGKKSYVYSTQKKGELDYKVWVKFSVE